MQEIREHGSEGNLEEALVAAAKRGEPEAFDRLISCHQKRILGLAHSITKNHHDAEDVMQESFHKAFVHLGSFGERARFSTWLTRIAINEACMLLRRRRTKREQLSDNSESEANCTLNYAVDRRPDPEQSYQSCEHREILQRAMNRLGSTVRSAVMLGMGEGRSTQEMALILGISTTAVKSRLSRGRRALHRELVALISARNPVHSTEKRTVLNAGQRKEKRNFTTRAGRPEIAATRVGS